MKVETTNELKYRVKGHKPKIKIYIRTQKRYTLEIPTPDVNNFFLRYT